VFNFKQINKNVSENEKIRNSLVWSETLPQHCNCLDIDIYVVQQ